MTSNWYPHKVGLKSYVKVASSSVIRPKKVKSCPICVNGQRRDAKTHEMRDCLVCKGTGKIL